MKFFNIDLHVSVIADIRRIFNDLGHDVDDWTLSGAVMAAHYSTDTISDFTFATTDASAGQATMSLAPAATLKLPDDTSVYDVEITNNSSGKVIRILEGVITSDPRAQR